jgi:hypothetical protein
LSDLIGELSTRGDAFVARWAADPGSQAEDQLKLLAIWAASQGPAAARPDRAQPSPRHD